MTMKKFLLVSIAIYIVMSVSPAFSETKINVYRYHCQDCGGTFFSFKGDALDSRELLDTSNQIKRVHQLANRDRLLDSCRGRQAHAFVRRGENSVSLGFIAGNLDRFAVVKDSGSVNVGFKTWECMLCGKTFYSIGRQNLNIKHWYDQPNRIYSLKGRRGIPKCEARGYYGHVFKEKSEGSISSYELARASILERIYWVQD